MSDLQSLLTDFAAARVALVERHEASARAVSHYDFNNTYQYVISREETHLSWLGSALTEIGAALPAASRALDVPPAAKPGKKSKQGSADIFRDILADDATQLTSFVERWRPRVAALTHARHRIMLDVILGESAEHARLFQQAASGFEDVLGRRTGGVARQGEVLPTRWLE